MRRENYPTYQLAVKSYLECDNRKFTKLIESEDLTVTEKNLLKARRYFSRGQFQEAITLLMGIGQNSCDFLNAEISLLLATGHSNLGQSENAFLYNGRAIAFYQKASDQRGEFLSTYNLSVDAEKLGLAKISHEYFTRAEALAETIEQKFLLSRAKACRLAQNLKYQEAYLEIKSSLKEAHTCPNALDVLTLKTVAVDLYFRGGDLSGMSELLEEIKNEKLLKPKARIFFSISALKFLEGRPLGIMPKYVKESKEFSLKWNILLALYSGDESRATTLWQELKNSFPLMYENDFQTTNQYERDSLFFKCIQSIQVKTTSLPAVSFEAGSKMAILHECLLNSKNPLRKEELIERIWKLPYDPSFDTRFYKLIQRLKDLSLPVVNDRRAYYYRSSQAS